MVHADKQVVPLVWQRHGLLVLFCCPALTDDALCQLFTLSGFSSRDAMSFTHGGLCEKASSFRFLFFLCPFVRCLKVVTDGALQVGFSFLPALRKSGRINGWPWFIPAPCKLAHGWYPGTRRHPAREDGGKAVKFSGVFTQRGHPPAVAMRQHCREYGGRGSRSHASSDSPCGVRQCNASPLWCEVHAVAVVYCEIKGVRILRFCSACSVVTTTDVKIKIIPEEREPDGCPCAHPSY